jgi:exonuclease VII small subunit
MSQEKTGKTKKSLSESLKEINAIIDWFENQEEVDVEQGLEKVKTGAKLIQDSRSRLKDIENEFEVVKKELEKE